MPLFKLKYWLILGMLLPLFLLAASFLSPDAPDYRVVQRGDGFELREYAPIKVAETRVGRDDADIDDAAYPALLDYVSGRNALQRKVPMLAPVMRQQAADGDWLVRFVLAKEYPMAMLPPPGNDDVVLRQLPEGLSAARRFSGGWSEDRWQAQADALRLSLERAGISPVGSPVFARYNAVFVPGLLRRNEVLWRVDR